MSDKKKLYIISGPTATGKTDISVHLAKRINGEIVSADSMQVYKFMDIGTAKPTQAEMLGIPHYLIDELYPVDEFSVSVFQKKAEKYIDEIYRNGKIPILAGGTGFYINSIMYGNNFTETNTDHKYRKELYELASNIGNTGLHRMLAEVDSKSAECIHCNNVKRIVRALEYYRLTGSRISDHNEMERQRELKYDTVHIILRMDRDRLYSRINRRVDRMVDSGLFDEVEWLLLQGYHENLVSMQGIGYKESVKYIHGHYPKQTAIEEIKKATRHFAKRQLTWFAHQTKEPYYIDVDIDKSKEAIIDEIEARFNFA